MRTPEGLRGAAKKLQMRRKEIDRNHQRHLLKTRQPYNYNLLRIKIDEKIVPIVNLCMPPTS